MLHTSKHEIMMPHAGAIFAIRGITPAYNAATPSVRTISLKTAAVPAEVVAEPPSAPDMSNACLRVFSTSKGEVRSAAVVPLNAPLANATPAPSYPARFRECLHDSYPAQYSPLNGTSRQRVGPRPRHR